MTIVRSEAILSVVKELLSRFKAYSEGDESAIPANLIGTTFRMVCSFTKFALDGVV